MASSSCENCGFTGELPATGACPRCGLAVAGFRVPPLPSPEGAVSSEVEPASEAPPGGYLDLDLGDGGKSDPAPYASPQHGTPPTGTPRRRPGQRTGPAFAAVAPKEVPGSAKSILPIVMWVAAGCVALIVLGVVLSRGSSDAPAAQGTIAPAPVAALPTPTPATPEPAPAVPAAAEPAPQPSAAPAITPAAVAKPEPAAPARRAEARTTERTRRERAPAPEPVRPARGARPEPTAAAPQTAAATAPAPAPAAAVAAPAAAPASPAAIEDAPRYAAEGFRRPQMAEPQCVQRSIRAPRDIADRVDGPVTIRFAVGPDGDISLFQIMGDVPDSRLPDMLESAVRACKFVPGADAQGRAVRMWVTMPIRFAR